MEKFLALFTEYRIACRMTLQKQISYIIAIYSDSNCYLYMFVYVKKMLILKEQKILAEIRPLENETAASMGGVKREIKTSKFR